MGRASGIVRFAGALIALAALLACDTRRSEPPVEPVAVAPSPVAVMASAPDPYPPLRARVTAVGWKADVLVERWQLMPGEGFADTRPDGAVDVKPLGERVHHVDQVPDGFKTETYTERVQDGYQTETYTDYESRSETETYTDRERCGEDCTGFGAKRRCTTKYCNRTKTRQVTKQKPVTKTRQKPKYKDVKKTRQVQQYKSVDRFAPFFSWRAFQWVVNRTVSHAGVDVVVTWPTDAELAPTAPLGKKETERTARSLSTWVDAKDAAGAMHRLDVKEADLAAMPVDAELELSGSGYRAWRVVSTPPATSALPSAAPTAAPTSSTSAGRASP